MPKAWRTRLTEPNPNVRAVAGNVLDPGSVASLVAGHDAAISAIGPRGGEANQALVDAVRDVLLASLSPARVRILRARLGLTTEPAARPRREIEAGALT